MKNPNYHGINFQDQFPQTPLARLTFPASHAIIPPERSGITCQKSQLFRHLSRRMR